MSLLRDNLWQHLYITWYGSQQVHTTSLNITTCLNKAIRDGKYLARHMPLFGNVHLIKIKNIFFRDIISLFSWVFIFLIDRATQEVSMKNIWKKLSVQFLAPPAERQRSFSNTDLSVVRLSVRPSVCPSVRPSVCPSRLRGGGVYLGNASVTFLLFWHEASFGWHKSHIER